MFVFDIVWYIFVKDTITDFVKKIFNLPSCHRSQTPNLSDWSKGPQSTHARQQSDGDPSRPRGFQGGSGALITKDSSQLLLHCISCHLQ